MLIRARVKDPRTGKLKEVRRVLPHVAKAEEARDVLREELAAAIYEEEKETIPTFSKFFGSWAERRISRGRIASESTRRVYSQIFKHQFAPRFGKILLDQIRRSDVDSWCDEMGREIAAKRLSPRTANMRLGLLCVLLRAAARQYGIPDPGVHVERFDTAEHPTYTEEEPNSLTEEETKRFLAACWKVQRGHYAMLCLGFATGQRPSTLRPLRRCGDSPDLIFRRDDSGQIVGATLLLRRSHSYGLTVMESTKTKRRIKIELPAGLAQILDWHVGQLSPKQQESDLLFPNSAGKLAAPARIAEAFAAIEAKAKIGKHITPRSMRRTFQDLCRSSSVHDFVTRSISGHVTVEMHSHYSTVSAAEQAQAIGAVAGKVIPFPAIQRSLGGVPGGVRGDQHAEEDTTTVGEPADIASA